MKRIVTRKRSYTGEGNPHWAGKRYCRSCGKELVTQDERKNKTCSFLCSIKSKIHVGENHPRWTGKKECTICSKELVGAVSRKNKTCSPECASKQKSLSRSGDKNTRWIEGKVFCRQCGVEIKHKRRWHNLCCSRKCSALWQSENLSKENSPLWKGGSAYGEYPPEFNAKLRSEIRKRDNHMCAICKKRMWLLDIHHIDENKQNSDPENLISLCRSCHAKVRWNPSLLNKE